MVNKIKKLFKHDVSCLLIISLNNHKPIIFIIISHKKSSKKDFFKIVDANRNKTHYNLISH